jgi:hypothetical protein
VLFDRRCVVYPFERLREMRKLEPEVESSFAGDVTMTIGMVRGIVPGQPRMNATDRAEKRKTRPSEINNLGYFSHSTFRG